ncbi:MAG: DNA starvation/stationary phase protection protein [Gammaproteobacteria bacterium]|nr:DNA starvation/stationary phase protection protein [Gammaproteobacteria bacterium]
MSTTTSPKSLQHSQKIADELTHLLADTYILYTKTQNFHWNVTGPHFYSLHKMFEEQYKELAEAVDIIAERIRALKAVAPGSQSHFLKLSSIKEENGVPDARDMLKQLAKDHETLAHHATIIFATAAKTHDDATLDVLTERMRSHEKTAWMLRSSIE